MSLWSYIGYEVTHMNFTWILLTSSSLVRSNSRELSLNKATWWGPSLRVTWNEQKLRCNNAFTILNSHSTYMVRGPLHCTNPGISLYYTSGASPGAVIMATQKPQNFVYIVHTSVTCVVISQQYCQLFCIFQYLKCCTPLISQSVLYRVWSTNPSI